MKTDPKKVLQGDQLAGGRLIRLLEEGAPEGIECLKAIFPHTGNAFVLGITGPPLSLIHISEPTRPFTLSRMPSSA